MSGPPGLSGEILCAGADVDGAVARAGAAGYSLEAYRKTREGPSHPDRDAQFRHITAQVRQFQERNINTRRQHPPPSWPPSP